MGRKKKVVVEEQPKQEETKANTTNAISYQGTVKVSIQKGKKILSTKTFHNTGKSNLFKFICNCLAGNYQDTAKPCKIALFKKGNSENIGDQDSITFTKDNLITPAVLFDTTPIVTLAKDNTSTDNNYYTVTYHFRIPYSYINGNEIYKAALFNSSPSLSDTEFTSSLYATYKFTKTTGTIPEWNPIVITDTETGNFSIIIEWTMSIKDINTK